MIAVLDYELRRSDPSLDESQEAVRDAFATFFGRECPTSAVRAAEPVGFDRALWGKLLEMGVAAMSLSTAVGGDDASLVDLVLAAEQWGRRIAPVPFASHIVATRLLAACEAPSSVIRPAMQGERVFTLAHAPALPGSAQLVPDAAIATDVIAVIGDRLVLHSSSLPAPHVLNQGCTPLAWWRPDDADERVTLACGRAAADACRNAVTEWKLLTAAALVGLTEQALEFGVEFARTRETMGVPIGSLQAVAYPLVDTAIDIAATRNLVYKAAWMMHNEPGVRPELPLMAFDEARRAATHGTRSVSHVQGGLGFTVEADSSLYFLRAKGWSAIAGDPATDLAAIGARLVAAGRG
jgi:alkylation response protein AidB-like acyl-CoA dehydrogenase